MKHPFDSLTYDILWKTRLYFDVFDNDAELVLDAENDGPEEWQKNLFDKFYKTQDEIKPRIYEAILNYYKEVLPEYREMFGSTGSSLVPDIDDIDGIRMLLTSDSVFIPDTYPEKEEVGILFECTWEPEHGLGVRIENGEVVEVGFQDVCL